jgi:hypothetical protein
LLIRAQAALGLDPYKDQDHPDFIDGVETKKDVEARRREEIMEAVRYGTYCGAWVVQSKEADRRLREDRLALRSRRVKEQQIEHTATSDAEAAWAEITLTSEWRIKDEEKWAENIKALMNKGIAACATTGDDDLYDRLEQLDSVQAEIKRHEVDRKAWQSHAERVVVLLPQEKQEGSLRKIEIIRYTMRMYHEEAHEIRRKLEKAIVDRGMHHELIDLPYKNLSENLRIYPRQGCERYIKALKSAVVLHEALERGEPVSDYQTAEVDNAQMEAIISCDSQTTALATDQAQNNWLLREIRKRLRPDGRELGFESEVETYEVDAKDEREDSFDGTQASVTQKHNMVYARTEEELPKKPEKSRSWFCC